MKNILSGVIRITQNFGEHTEWYAKWNLKGHNGVDFGCPEGTLCYSPIEGGAVEVSDDPQGYGLYVKIENEKEGCIFAHLSKQKLLVGDHVRAGDLIGLTGNTGNSTGPHLHFGYFPKPRDRTNGYAGYIDPMPFLNTEEGVSMTPFESFLDYQLTGPDYVTLNIQEAPLDHNLDLGGTRGRSALRDWAVRANQVVELQKTNHDLTDTNNSLSAEIDQTRKDAKASVDTALADKKLAEGQLQGLQTKLVAVSQERDDLKTDVEGTTNRPGYKQQILDLEKENLALQEAPLKNLKTKDYWRLFWESILGK